VCKIRAAHSRGVRLARKYRPERRLEAQSQASLPNIRKYFVLRIIFHKRFKITKLSEHLHNGISLASNSKISFSFSHVLSSRSDP
jgi:hypothetical protein